MLWPRMHHPQEEKISGLLATKFQNRAWEKTVLSGCLRQTVGALLQHNKQFRTDQTCIWMIWCLFLCLKSRTLQLSLMLSVRSLLSELYLYSSPPILGFVCFWQAVIEDNEVKIVNICPSFAKVCLAYKIKESQFELRINTGLIAAKVCLYCCYMYLILVSYSILFGPLSINEELQITWRIDK